MLARFRNFLKAPIYEDPELNIQAQNLSVILRALMVLTLLFLLYAVFSPPITQIIIAVVAIGFEFGLMVMLKNRQLQLAGILFVNFLWIAIFAEVILYGGIRDSGFASFAIVIVIAGLTLGVRGGIISTIVTVIAGIGLSIAEYNGLLPPYVHTPIESVLVSYVITFTAISLLLYLAIHSITSTEKKALKNERLQKEINTQLEESQSTLREQEAALEQRNITLQIATDVSRLTIQAKSEEKLLDESAQLLAERLGLQHVGIYLLSQTEEIAIICVSNSSEGKTLVASGYHLNVARSKFMFAAPGNELLHYQAGNRDYRIEQPMQLQGTNVNLSFPLISGEHLLGLINIQTTSSVPYKIDQESIQTLADQISLSLENLRLVDQLQSRVKEVGLLAGQTVQNAWEQLRKGKSFGYYYDRLQVVPTNQVFPAKITEQLLEGKSVTYITPGDSQQSRLVAPILLRGIVIGVIGYEDSDSHHEWMAEEKILIETISSRVSQALENTRLVADAQQRAEREALISEISSKISASIQLDTIMRTSVEELGHALSDSEVTIQIGNNSPRGDQNE